MRSNWIEARSSAGILFQATKTGKRRADEEALPPQVQTHVRWLSVCFERLTGTWIRAEDLDLVYEDDLPNNAEQLPAKLNTLHASDGALRDLFKLALDETLEPVEPQFRNPSRPYARIMIAFDQIEQGLPATCSLGLKRAVLDEVGPTTSSTADMKSLPAPQIQEGSASDFLTKESFIVGGPGHKALLSDCLKTAKSRVILHSCFLDPVAVEKLIPEFEEAAKRNVRVDLLWGFQQDPEEKLTRNIVAETIQVLGRLSESARKKIHFSPLSSLSHAKVLMFDEGQKGAFTTIMGSCNFLQSQFVSLDVSVRVHSQRLALQLLSRLLATQIPPSGSWPAVARRLNNDWDRIRYLADVVEQGPHRLTLLADQDHYACVRYARDVARGSILIGCDIYGVAAETSVLAPMQRAAELGKKVRLLYQRPSKLLRESGRAPEPEAIKKRGIALEQCPGLHGKFIVWDDQHVGITSFNWLSTVAEGARINSAELGVLISGPSVRDFFAEEALGASGGKIDLYTRAEPQGAFDLGDQTGR
jgi:hypothetical protein